MRRSHRGSGRTARRDMPPCSPVRARPSITMPWPEAKALGFETVLAAKDFGYRGQPFNWVTMPDQFTLARYEDLLDSDMKPGFVQIALISSHAPWTPVPELVPWTRSATAG